MTYTLISIIGTGMYKTLSNFDGYVETDYIFNSDTHCKTRLFMQAVLQCGKKQITQIILLGTDTSSWDCLVDKENDDREETLSLWDSLFDQCEVKEAGRQPLGVTRENLNKLESYLTTRFSIPVIIKTHSHNIDDKTSEELFNCYTEITKLVKKGNSILFDITHGFRSMPVLLYQSLQYTLSQFGHKQNVEIIYGELDVIDKSKAYFRSLSSYWQYSELGMAMQLFDAKLDGFKLASLIAKEWEKGSKAIHHFSEIVQTNFALQLFDVLPQIRNALKAYTEDTPAWLLPVKKLLEDMLSQLQGHTKPLILYNYSKFLNARHLNVQAVITLQIAVETAIVEKFANETYLGDYDWWQSYGKNELTKIKSENRHELGSPLTTLEAFRNQIAHGGGKNKKSGNFPHVANITEIYESGLTGVEKLLNYLECM